MQAEHRNCLERGLQVAHWLFSSTPSTGFCNIKQWSLEVIIRFLQHCIFPACGPCLPPPSIACQQRDGQQNGKQIDQSSPVSRQKNSVFLSNRGLYHSWRMCLMPDNCRRIQIFLHNNHMLIFTTTRQSFCRKTFAEAVGRRASWIVLSSLMLSIWWSPLFY